MIKVFVLETVISYLIVHGRINFIESPLKGWHPLPSLSRIRKVAFVSSPYRYDLSNYSDDILQHYQELEISEDDIYDKLPYGYLLGFADADVPTKIARGKFRWKFENAEYLTEPLAMPGMNTKNRIYQIDMLRYTNRKHLLIRA